MQKAASINISTEDQLYVLSEALDTFLESCDPKHWRATAAAEELNSQVKKLRQSLQTR